MCVCTINRKNIKKSIFNKYLKLHYVKWVWAECSSLIFSEREVYRLGQCFQKDRLYNKKRLRNKTGPCAFIENRFLLEKKKGIR